MSSRPQIIVNMEFDPEYLERLTSLGDVTDLQGRSREEILESVPSTNAFVGWLEMDEAFFDLATNLRVASTHSVGYNHIDVDAATKRGIAVCNTPGVLNAAVADLAMLMILMLSRKALQFEQFSRSGTWGKGEWPEYLGNDIAGKTLGVVGYGRIGREVARRRAALGMRPVWYDIFDQPPPDAPDAPKRSLDDLLRESDFVTVHLDLNESTHHLIGERELGLMKNTAYLVNTARGLVVDQAALTRALENGTIAGAALDVLEKEPPEADERIVQLPNVITFPHIGTATEETRKAMRELTVDNAVNVLTGKTPRAIVNPSVLE